MMCYMKKIKNIITILLLLVPLASSAVTVHHFPYEIRFDRPGDTVGWTFAATDSAYSRHWVIDSLPDYAFWGGRCLHIRENNQFKISQNRNTQCAMTAYLRIDSLPAGSYNVSFRYRSTDRFSNHRLSYGVRNAPPTYELTNPSSGYYQSDNIRDDYWIEKQFTFTTDGTSASYLIFRYWIGNNRTDTNQYQSVAIDAIQISPVRSPLDCHAAPLALSHTRSANNAVFSWAGNASEYQVQYFMNDTSANYFYTQTNVTSTSYSIDCATIPEGSYTFRVRSICGFDTSEWVSLDYQLLYDINKHCLDYLNFNDPAVTGHTGSARNSYLSPGIVDNGYKSSSSRQTVHHMPRQKDPRTNYKMRAFPSNQPAALRLGNWATGANAEDMVYTIHVDPGTDIIKMQYALVMQLPGHDSIQQPHFQLEFLDTTGTIIDSCGYVDFTASNNLVGWHTEHVPGEADVIWKDWSLIALNIGQYVGRTIQIRLTTKDCTEGAHYGYAYFTLQCTSAKMEGRNCGVKPNHFTVEEGFNYRWYHKYDNSRTILGTDRTYTLTNPVDTATYCVDLINLLKPNCYFTMEASSLAYVPEAGATLRYDPSDCRNFVQFIDTSHTLGVYWEGERKVIVTSTDSVDSYYWDFGQYGSSTERNPRIAFPSTGDSLRVVLHVYYEDCEDTFAMIVKVPLLETKRTTNLYRICEGSSITLGDITYTLEGDYADTLRSWTGCDSLSIVAIRYIVPDTMYYNDTVCESDGPYHWHDLTITQDGVYMFNQLTSNCLCDSVLHIDSVYFRPILNASFSVPTIDLCLGGDNIINIPVSVSSGEIATYDLLFDPVLAAYGLKDSIGMQMSDGGVLTLDFSGDIWPGQYEARLVLRNYACDSVVVNIPISVHYGADSLITQRWNDFLAVRKSAYDRYGGFYDYQWYRDGLPLPGEISSELYLPETGLSASSTYQVALTRIVDNVRVITCAYTPIVEPNTTTIQVYPSHTTATCPHPITISSNHAAYCQLYSPVGVLLRQWHISAGQSEFTLPATSGLYILRITLDDGSVQLVKLMVE